MSKYKVLYLTTGSFTGGADRSLLELLKNLDRDKFIPIAIIPPKGPIYEYFDPQGDELGLLETAISALGVEVLPIECTRLRVSSFPGFLRTVYQVTQSVRKHRIDLIHSNDFLPNQYAVFSSKLTRTPIVTHVRLILSKRGITRTFLRFSDRIIANSQATADSLLSSGISSAQMQVIHNGVDLNQYRFSTETRKLFRAKWGINKDIFLVGILSRICKLKGQDIAICAFAKALKTCPDMMLIIIGSTFIDNSKDFFQELNHLVKKFGLEHKVIFTGFLENPVDAYSGIDLLLLPSEEEPFGRVLIEAMATERPVISTDCGGPKDIIIDGITGKLIPPKDVDALASAMVEIASHKDVAFKMGKRGRYEAEQRFSSEMMTRKIEQVYRELLERT